jgi:hypothetical protein
MLGVANIPRSGRTLTIDIGVYLLNQETAYRILHAPISKAQYNEFWEDTGHTGGFVPLLHGMPGVWATSKAKTSYAVARRWLNGLGRKQIVEVEKLKIVVCHGADQGHLEPA